MKKIIALIILATSSITYADCVIKGSHNSRLGEMIQKDGWYFENFNELCEELKQHDIIARKYFYPITNSFECYRDDYDSDELRFYLFFIAHFFDGGAWSDKNIAGIKRFINRFKEWMSREGDDTIDIES